MNDADTTPVGRFEWERVIRRIPLPQGVKLLALVLATYADADGSRVRPGLDLLVSDTGQSKATVKRGLAQLRDDLGVLELVSRGGGRGGQGKAATYRLAFPHDLLDRVELAPIPGDSELTEVSSQSPESELIQVSHENDFQGSNPATSDGMRAQIDQLRAHPGEPLPPTSPTTTTDQPSGHHPTQLPDARASPKPAKCPHGLPNHTRSDRTPACFACRRGLPSGKDPPWPTTAPAS
ncbi:hypothetical protein [Amycolatopsis kentuckyensis]|uniref:hypothetical protein n=1 Tax=Amycolatopsis kentuckyensis TaxID=218823 RepID=UPI001178BE9C|nr:hypothetical protein [Amycolatopsis kentuckyensis]